MAKRQVSDYAMSLAETIASKRQREVEEQFYVEVSEKTYRKWYVEPMYGDEPYLRTSEHGGYVTYGQYPHYFMLKRSKYSSYKKGNRIVPRKPSMSKAAKTARELMMIGWDMSILLNRTMNGVEMTLGYETTPSFYKGTEFNVKFSSGVMSASSEIKGRTSSLDKLILKSVKDWSETRGITCSVECIGGND